MAYLLIPPVGLSLKRNLEKLFDFSLSRGKEHEQLIAYLEALRSNFGALSAELSILSKYPLGPEDRVVFLATDTDDAEAAANGNAFLVKKFFGSTTDVRRIPGLTLDNAEKFVKEGLRNFLSAVEHFVTEAEDQGFTPVLSIAGGIKAVLPYAAIYGMIRGFPIVYVFEQTQSLVTIPSLPLDFDWEALENLIRICPELEKEGVVNLYRLQKLLGQDYAKLEGLFEQEGNQVTLSAFGHLLLDKLRAVQQLPVMLSPSAQEKLNTLTGVERAIMERLLDRVRNPFWRAQKIHPFEGTDLMVFKPGRARQRLAVCANRNGIVYVAEIYASHDEYERDLPQRSAQNYDLNEFKAYYPQPQPVSPKTLEEAKGDELIACAMESAAKAEREKEEALNLAEEMEREVSSLKEEMKRQNLRVEELVTALARLEERERERASWGLLRRLRWALFKS